MDFFYIVWLAVAGVSILFFAIVGRKITDNRWGILLDSRNKVSLSQLQVVVWTIIIMSAFLAVAVVYQTSDIEMGAEIWGVMGISVGSTFSSLTIKSMKPDKQPKNAKILTMAEGVRLKGIQVVNETSSLARFLDIFMGEEQVDFNYVDIGKVQMFMVSVALWIGYTFTLVADLPDAIAGAGDGPVVFPEFSPTMLTLLAISHAGYLSVKAVDKTPTA